MSFDPYNNNPGQAIPAQGEVVYGGQASDGKVFAQVGVNRPAVPVDATSIDTLTAYAQGVVVRLPDFAENQPLVVRMRRPSLLVLAKSGKIPNELLSTAGKLFNEGGSGMDTDDSGMLGKMYDLMEIIAKSALISPSFEQITNVGLNLTDEQLMAIFNYSQSGVRALEPFRTE